MNRRTQRIKANSAVLALLSAGLLWGASDAAGAARKLREMGE